MSYNLILAPQTGASNAGTTPAAQAWSFLESEQIVVVANGLATTETVTVQVASTLGDTPLYGAATANFLYQLTATSQALVVPGGYLLKFFKTSTVGAVGIEVHFKPRVGGGAS